VFREYKLINSSSGVCKLPYYPDLAKFDHIVITVLDKLTSFSEANFQKSRTKLSPIDIDSSMYSKIT